MTNIILFFSEGASELSQWVAAPGMKPKSASLSFQKRCRDRTPDSVSLSRRCSAYRIPMTSKEEDMFDQRQRRIAWWATLATVAVCLSGIRVELQRERAPDALAGTAHGSPVHQPFEGP